MIDILRNISAAGQSIIGIDLLENGMETSSGLRGVQAPFYSFEGGPGTPGNVSISAIP
jgi:hypothetical protein